MVVQKTRNLAKTVRVLLTVDNHCPDNNQEVYLAVMFKPITPLGSLTPLTNQPLLRVKIIQAMADLYHRNRVRKVAATTVTRALKLKAENRRLI
jgi:hypothetical protein